MGHDACGVGFVADTRRHPSHCTLALGMVFVDPAHCLRAEGIRESVAPDGLTGGVVVNE